MTSRVQFFGEYLVAGGHVSPGGLERAVAYQREHNLPLGRIAVREGLMTEVQVAEIHQEQRRTDERFGELAVARGYLAREALERLLRGQAEQRVYLGEALVRLELLSREAVDTALAAFEREQAEASERVRALLFEAAGEALVGSAVELTQRMLLRMARRVAKVRDAQRDPGPVPAGLRSFRQEVRGDRPFTIALSLPEPLLLEVAGALLASAGEAAPTVVDEATLDAGKELLNVIVGQTCTALQAEGSTAMPEPPELGAPPASGSTRARVVIAMPEGEALLDLVTP